MSIISKINNVIKNKEKLFVTNSGIPYIENACCNDKKLNTYLYFIEEDNSIETEINYIKSLVGIIKTTNLLNRGSLMFSEKNNKTILPLVNSNYSEETIYRAFIKYC